ncbi:unnamed protein product [Trifolium pratense]|uniref:Uncharacterized protein n=1 Tax=Trifolium pratense TaxID=57577 RepID=A0ACB0JHC1_TRIPR|nr:unnamed protein product [Trifolium pratense]
MSDAYWRYAAESQQQQQQHPLPSPANVPVPITIFIAQEQICLKRLWVSNIPYWEVSYKSQMKRNRMVVKLVENSTFEGIKNGEKMLTVYFLSVEIPVWILFFALGVTSDKEIVDLIDYEEGDGRVDNILFASIREADEKCETFRRGKNALLFLEERVKGVQFPPPESIDECLDMYVFPSIKGLKRKARYLAYMVKVLLLAGIYWPPKN